MSDIAAMPIPIPNHKTVCPRITPEGWTYGGFDEGYYLFQRGDYRTGFVLMECLEEDLTAENLALMARLSVTRVRSFANTEGKVSK